MELDATSPYLDWQPSGGDITLARHQQASIYKCGEIEKHSRYVLLRDKIGAGKTYTTLGYLRAIRDEMISQTASTTLGSKLRRLFGNVVGSRQYGVTIIVVPFNICEQWRNALVSMGGLEYMVISEYSAMMAIMLDGSKIEKVDVILTVPLFLEMITNVDTNIRYERLIIDEVSSCMNIMPGINKIVQLAKYKYIWYISASIMQSANYSVIKTSLANDETTIHVSLPNDRLNLYIERTYMPEADEHNINLTQILGDISVICADEFIRQAFILPDPVLAVYNIYNEYIEKLFPYILSDTDMGNITKQTYNKMVLSGSMPVMEIARTIEDVIKIVCKDIVSEMDGLVEYMAAAQIDTTKLGAREHAELYMSGMEYDMRVRHHVKMKRYIEIVGRFNELRERLVEANLCIICYESIGENHAGTCVLKCCNNAICMECIVNLRKRDAGLKCPMCRTMYGLEELIVIMTNPVVVNDQKQMDTLNNIAMLSYEPGSHQLLSNDIVRQYKKEHPEAKYINTNDKMYIFEQLMNNIMRTRGTEARILVFSENENHISYLMSNYYSNIRYENIMNCGSLDLITQLLRRYKARDVVADDYVQMLAVSSYMFGYGMNLENTTDVILMHIISDFQEKQIVGRAQRYGRTAPLNIWKIVYHNEVE
jgi:hypothetical protein